MLIFDVLYMIITFYRERKMTELSDNWTTRINQMIDDSETYIKTWNLRGASEFKLGRRTIDNSPKRRSSRGGLYKIKGIYMPGINLAVNHFFKNNGPVHYFSEYASFRKSTSIGSFYTEGLDLVFNALVCHEMAHAIQYWHTYYTKGDKTLPHGPEFKYYYQTLRDRFVNPFLPNQIMAKRYYETGIDPWLKKAAL
jgi:hypothetical protein